MNEKLQKILEGKNLKVFGCEGGSGSVLQGESDAGNFNFDAVFGDYLVGEDHIEDQDEIDEATSAINEAANEQGAWVERPLFWATEECPAEYVGQVVSTLDVLRARAEFEDSGYKYEIVDEWGDTSGYVSHLIEASNGVDTFRARHTDETVDDLRWEEI